MRLRHLLWSIGMLSGVFTFALISQGCGGTAPNTTANKVANKIEKVADSSGHFQTVTIDSPDGVKIVGSYYPAAQANSPALLLMHQWESDRHSYDEFAAKINDKGFAVLSIDGRGFGES